jgi:hypothetical protein
MQFEVLYHELARSVDIIRTLVADMTLEEARARPGPESWSALEVMCHLCDEEREDFRQRLDLILHQPDAPFPPIDPQGWVKARRYNERDLAEMVEKWTAERVQSLAWLKGLSAPDWETEHVDQYGSIKAGEMLSCWVAHDNLHTRQLVELRRDRLLRLTTPYDVAYAGEW